MADWAQFYSASNSGPNSYIGQMLRNAGLPPGAAGGFGFKPGQSALSSENFNSQRALVGAAHSNWRQQQDAMNARYAAAGRQTPQQERQALYDRNRAASTGNEPGGAGIASSGPGVQAPGFQPPPAVGPMPIGQPETPGAPKPTGFAALKPNTGGAPRPQAGGLGFSQWGGRR